MYVRVLRLPVYAAASALVAVTLAASPAVAGKPAPAPTGLGATATAHEDGSYDIVADWDAVPTATSYRVQLTKGGTTLESATVTTTSWSDTLTTTPGNATLSVRGLVGKKPGRTATLLVGLLDVTPPQGTYTSMWTNNDGHATITEKALTDNSAVSGVTRTVNWDDGSDSEPWPSGETTLDHTYPLTEKRYVPTVTLEDAAHNVRVVDVDAIVINDDEAPTGTFANEIATAWTAFTQVSVSESDINDNWTPDAQITRSVDWGDGTTTDWTTDVPATHVYADAGAYTPVVTLTDEAGNSAPESTSEVVVTTDTARPTLKVTVPKAKHSVQAWKTVRGKATDAQTGVKSVWLKAVEKRGAAWYGYNATTHAWVKAASKAKAFKKAKAFNRTTNDLGRWTAKLGHLKKGTLVLKVRATDHVHNRSTLTRQATLTKP
jgi:5'-nucleotidase